MRILIIGAGDVGFQLGRRLSRDQHDITIVDEDPAKVRRAAEQLDGLAIEGSGDSYQVLLQAGLRDADVVAAVTDNDDANLMACRLAKACGVDVTIARVRNAEFTQPGFPLTTAQLGADHIIHPEREAGNAILRLLQESSATHVIDLENGQIEVIGLILEADSPLVGLPLAELGVRYHRPPVQIVAIERNHETIIPKGNDLLHAGDLLFAVCAPEYAKEFFGLAGKRKKPRMDNIMIMGGGMIARFIAEELAGAASIKIIEHDLARAERLADCLPRALVIHSDGTELELLQAEDLDQMDAFVAVTGDDENNIIATLLARQHEVPRPIALPPGSPKQSGAVRGAAPDCFGEPGGLPPYSAYYRPQRRDQQTDFDGQCRPAIYPTPTGGGDRQSSRHRGADDRIHCSRAFAYHPTPPA